MYGDLESGFAYETQRNEDFTQPEPHGAGCRQREKGSVFSYNDSTTVVKSGAIAHCSLIAFVDDHIAFGHPKAGKRLTTSLAQKIEYPADAFQTVGRTDVMQRIAHVIALDIVLQITPLYQQVIFNQTVLASYG